MLGNAVFRTLLSLPKQYSIHGSVRSSKFCELFPEIPSESISVGIDVENIDSLLELFERTTPDIVINCIGLVKQHSDARDPLVTLPINALFPHRLLKICGIRGARLIHISSDCVFQGTKGMYTEHDCSDATDLYGKSKYIGEVSAPHAITLRTSIIGHELNNSRGVIEWFLSQEQEINGFTQAIFSGLPTIELAEVIRDVVIPNSQLNGLYHVAGAPISKFDLLKIVGKIYNRPTKINPCEDLIVDRSLDASRFSDATGYLAPDWETLIKKMHHFR